jgi:hypothetical protein
MAPRFQDLQRNMSVLGRRGPAAQYGAIANRGQAGGISSISPQARKAALDNIQRSKFFKGRDVGEDRLRRRIKQDTLDKQFIDKFTKPVVGSSNLLQMTDDAPRSLAAERERLANIYGPTPSEIAGDIGFGLSRIAEGFAQKGTPLFQVVTGLGQKFKSGVEQLWDRVRGETPEQVGTAFPQPSIDTKDLFSSIETGTAKIDPDNLLVQIAKENEGRFNNNQTFEEQLANSTAQNFNIPDPRKIGETITDYITAAQRGVNVDTPIGNVNINPLANRVFLDGGIGPINYGGSINPDTLNYDAGIKTVLPFDIGLSAGIQSNDIPGVSFGKNLGPIDANLSFSRQGGSLGFNTTVDPLRAIFPGSAIGTPINLGASIDSTGRVTPNVGFALPFKKGGSVNKNSGLGYMLK